jgi:hypothetical protein
LKNKIPNKKIFSQSNRIHSLLYRDIITWPALVDLTHLPTILEVGRRNIERKGEMKGQRSSPRTRNGGDAKNLGYSLPVAFLFFYTRQMPPVAILLGYECSLKEETTNVSTTFHTTISIMTRGTNT